MLRCLPTQLYCSFSEEKNDFYSLQPSYWKYQKTTSLNNWGYLLKSSWDILQNQRMGIGLVLSNNWNPEINFRFSPSCVYYLLCESIKNFFSGQVTSVLCYLWWETWETHWENSKTWHLGFHGKTWITRKTVTFTLKFLKFWENTMNGWLHYSLVASSRLTNCGQEGIVITK